MNTTHTVNNKEFSMEDPTLKHFPHLSIGSEFTFKGDKVKVNRFSSNGKGFWYTKLNTKTEGYMSFYYYMSTPSAKGRKL